MANNFKQIRSNCTSTILSVEGELVGYRITFPISNLFVQEYGFENVFVRTKVSKKGEYYKLHFYEFDSKDFKEIKKKIIQLQVMISSMKLKNEQKTLQYLTEKMNKTYELN